MDVLDDSSKGGFRERSVAVGKQASLQKQLQELTKSHQVRSRLCSTCVLLLCQPTRATTLHCMLCTPQDLVKRYEAKDQKCDELRSKFTTTKAALSSRERELESAQRALQGCAVEKKLLKVTKRKIGSKRIQPPV
jgi:hypothetical protein